MSIHKTIYLLLNGKWNSYYPFCLTSITYIRILKPYFKTHAMGPYSLTDLHSGHPLAIYCTQTTHPQFLTYFHSGPYLPILRHSGSMPSNFLTCTSITFSIKCPAGMQLSNQVESNSEIWLKCMYILLDPTGEIMLKPIDQMRLKPTEDIWLKYL